MDSWLFQILYSFLLAQYKNAICTKENLAGWSFTNSSQVQGYLCSTFGNGFFRQPRFLHFLNYPKSTISLHITLTRSTYLHEKWQMILFFGFPGFVSSGIFQSIISTIVQGDKVEHSILEWLDSYLAIFILLTVCHEHFCWS